MRLTDERHAMPAGEAAPARQWVIEHQMHIGHSLDAADSDHVSQAQMIADTRYNPTGPRLLDEK